MQREAAQHPIWNDVFVIKASSIAFVTGHTTHKAPIQIRGKCDEGLAAEVAHGAIEVNERSFSIDGHERVGSDLRAEQRCCVPYDSLKSPRVQAPGTHADT